MRKKGFKKIAALMMSVLIMACCCVEPLHAADYGVMPLSLDEVKTVSLSIKSGKATSTCTVAGTGKTIDKISITLYLQKKNSSGVWITYDSWSSTRYSYVHSLQKTCSIPSGIYRARAKVVCTNGSRTETTYMNTGAKER